jgi:hypothetical protein
MKAADVMATNGISVGPEIRAALGSAAAVMLVPQRVVRQTGAVVALAENLYGS